MILQVLLTVWYSALTKIHIKVRKNTISPFNISILSIQSCRKHEEKRQAGEPYSMGDGCKHIRFATTGCKMLANNGGVSIFPDLFSSCFLQL
jgi:hypothetical protein